MVLFSNPSPARNANRNLSQRNSARPGNRGPQPAVHLPQELKRDGRSLVLAGQGRFAGSYVYLDLVSNQTQELLLGRVERIVGESVLVEVPGQHSLSILQVPRQAVRTSDKLPLATGADVLMGGIRWSGELPRAEWAVVCGSTNAASWQQGTIQRMHSSEKFGEIVTAAGACYFFHVSVLRQGAVATVGFRVRFRGYDKPGKGLTASEVQPG